VPPYTQAERDFLRALAKAWDNSAFAELNNDALDDAARAVLAESDQYADQLRDIAALRAAHAALEERVREACDMLRKVYDRSAYKPETAIYQVIALLEGRTGEGAGA